MCVHDKPVYINLSLRVEPLLDVLADKYNFPGPAGCGNMMNSPQ